MGSFPGFNGFRAHRIDAYAVFDASAAWDVPGVPGVSLSLSVYNLFDDRHQELPGLPELGRVALGRVRWSF